VNNSNRRIVYFCFAAMLGLVLLGLGHRAQAQDKGEGFNDAVIGELVKSAINNDAALGKMDISIDVQDRVVHLSGFVKSLGDSAKAESLARAVQGVTGVRNAIRVANRPSRA
jgi:osmotically-inducible protein OsmY